LTECLDRLDGYRTYYRYIYLLQLLFSIEMAQLTNKTGENLLVYGDNPEPEGTPGRTDNILYILPHNHQTPPNWDCDGFYVPNNRIAEQLLFPTTQGPVAVKYVDGQFPTITMPSITKYSCPGNFAVIDPKEGVNWPIPNISYDDLENGNFPRVPNSILVD
jgi:hypothetical protein